MPGGPAMLSKKINVGDKIISIGQGISGDMINVIGWRLDDIVDSIRGDEGTIVKLEIETDTGNKIIEIQRGKISLEESDASKEIIERNGISTRAKLAINIRIQKKSEKSYCSKTNIWKSL